MSISDLPDHAPLPDIAHGAALNDQGFHVGRVERNLFWVTDTVYLSAFLLTEVPDLVDLGGCQMVEENALGTRRMDLVPCSSPGLRLVQRLDAAHVSRSGPRATA